MDPNLPTREEAELEEGEKGEKQKIPLARNALTMSSLTLAIQEDDDIAALYEAKSNEWPTGLAHLVMKELKDTHAPQDIVTNLDCGFEV